MKVFALVVVLLFGAGCVAENICDTDRQQLEQLLNDGGGGDRGAVIPLRGKRLYRLRRKHVLRDFAHEPSLGQDLRMQAMRPRWSRGIR